MTLSKVEKALSHAHADKPPRDLSPEENTRIEMQTRREVARRLPFAGQPAIDHPAQMFDFGTTPVDGVDPTGLLDVPLVPIGRFLRRMGFVVEFGSAGQIITRNKAWQPNITFTGEAAWAFELAKLNESYACEKAAVPDVLVAFYSVCLEVQWSRQRGIPMYSLWWHDFIAMLDYTRWIQDRFGRVDNEEVPQDPKPPKRRGIPKPGIMNIARRRNR